VNQAPILTRRIATAYHVLLVFIKREPALRFASSAPWEASRSERRFHVSYALQASSAITWVRQAALIVPPVLFPSSLVVLTSRSANFARWVNIQALDHRCVVYVSQVLSGAAHDATTVILGLIRL